MFPLARSKKKPAKNGGLKRDSSNLDPGRRLYPTPKPPRNTALFSRLWPKTVFGLQAKPICGPKLFRYGLNRSPPALILAPRRDPLGPRTRFEILSLELRSGVKYSHRRPRFTVRFGRSFQSSCTNRA